MNQKIKKRIDALNNKEAVRFFFRLTNDLIKSLNLDAKNEKLAFNLPKVTSKRISVNLNGRLVLFINAENEFGLMVNETDLPIIKKILKIKRIEKFNGWQPQALLIYVDYDILVKQIDVIKPLWLKSCADYEPTQTKSQYRIHHIPELFEMAKNESLLNEYLEEKGTMQNSFDKIIGDLKEYLKKEKNLSNKFTIQIKSVKSGYVWISDSQKIIGNKIAHYEIAERNNNKIYVDVHFEGNQEQKDKFSESIKVLPENIIWFKWNKSKSLRNQEYIEINDKEILSKLTKQLLYFEENLGNKIREVMKNIDIINKKDGNLIMNKQSLNQILYGPPGTGKTYNSIDKAVEIATPESYIKDNHEANKKQFDELRKQGQIEFITFHQNYSYEDFMIGIRPNVNEGIDTLTFKKHNGIFYNLSKRARDNYENSLKDELTISRENWVKEKFEEFKEFVQTEIEEKGKFQIKNKVSIYSVEEEVFIYTGEKEDGLLWKNPRIGMHYDALIKIYLADVKSRKDIKELDNIPSLEKQHSTYSFELIQKFEDFLNHNHYKYQVSTIKKEPLKNYVLVIDEINRANISKVFGELITLLEDDKRLGAENELRITLPNGEKEFGVPPNVFIIGTMNTADKSIALIDIALRRRFEFIGYYPIYEGYEEEAIILLQKINTAIFEKKKSADYLIGHAYFMKNQPIQLVLQNKVIPLLMEYFSGKTDIVTEIFAGTNWSVKYDTNTYNWDILIS